MYFFDKIKREIVDKGTHLCVGIDPHKKGLGAFLDSEFAENPNQTLTNFCNVLVKASADKVSAVKYQSAFFESFGHWGIEILKKSIFMAKKCGLKTILDNKRGDISSTMLAYAETTFDYFEADAMTVTPYMGVDTLTPLQTYLESGRGVYVVWRTSNPNSGALQNCLLKDGTPFYLHAMNLIHRWTKDHSLSQAVGYVLGATNCDDIDKGLRSGILEMSDGRWLMPGFGSQGAKESQSLRELRSRKNDLIPVSRALYTHNEEINSWHDLSVIVSENIQMYADQFKFN
jgi:orotidine-5'-phosphate decarboxylase